MNRGSAYKEFKEIIEELRRQGYSSDEIYRICSQLEELIEIEASRRYSDNRQQEILRQFAAGLREEQERKSSYYNTLFDYLQLYFFDGSGLFFMFFFLFPALTIPPLALFLLFITSRFMDYLTTQLGLASGGIETNPASEARRLTGFWRNLIFYGFVFGLFTIIFHICQIVFSSRSPSMVHTPTGVSEWLIGAFYLY